MNAYAIVKVDMSLYRDTGDKILEAFRLAKLWGCAVEFKSPFAIEYRIFPDADIDKILSSLEEKTPIVPGNKYSENIVTSSLIKEIQRCEELLEAYKKIPSGGFAWLMITESVAAARLALKLGDPHKIGEALDNLKEIE